MRDTITIRVPEEIKAEMDRIAREEGISRSVLVRESLAITCSAEASASFEGG